MRPQSSEQTCFEELHRHLDLKIVYSDGNCWIRPERGASTLDSAASLPVKYVMLHSYRPIWWQCIAQGFQNCLSSPSPAATDPQVASARGRKSGVWLYLCFYLVNSESYSFVQMVLCCCSAGPDPLNTQRASVQIVVKGLS